MVARVFHSPEGGKRRSSFSRASISAIRGHSSSLPQAGGPNSCPIPNFQFPRDSIDRPGLTAWGTARSVQTWTPDAATDSLWKLGVGAWELGSFCLEGRQHFHGSRRRRWRGAFLEEAAAE